MNIGILAVQGDYAAHAQTLSQLQVDWSYVRRPEDLSQVQGLILPGGESTTCLKLMQENGLFAAIKVFNKPMFGTCAGAILLAKEVIMTAQTSLSLVDVCIERNAYGRQLASRIVQGKTSLHESPLEMVFIRAPRIIKLLSDDVQVLATCQDEIVCVQQHHYVLATFHPELTQDFTLHQHFINLVKMS